MSSPDAARGGLTPLLAKIRRHLRRPLIELVPFAIDKLRSHLWRRHLGSVGRGFHVCRGAQLAGADRIHIGDGFYAGQLLWIEAVKRYREFEYDPVIEIGHNVVCSQSVHIAATERVTIGDGVLFGSRVHITDHGHGTYHGDQQNSPLTPPVARRLPIGRPVVVGRNVWFGDGVVVLPGVTIGDGCIIGANSVVSRDLPPAVIAFGAPAVPTKRYDADTGRWLPISPTP